MPTPDSDGSLVAPTEISVFIDADGSVTFSAMPSDLVEVAAILGSSNQHAPGTFECSPREPREVV